MNWTVEDRGYETPCWIWNGPLNDRGYGLTASAFGRVAHRALWVERNGPVPEGFELDHLCRVRSCVRADHLDVVTHQENMRRSAVARYERSADHHPLLASRLRAALSQTQLAERLNVSQAIVGLWERGRVPVPRQLDVERLEWAEPYRHAAVALRRPIVRAMHEEGATVAEIAAALDIGSDAIYADVRWWRARGVTMPQRNPAFDDIEEMTRNAAERVASGETMTRVAADIGISRQALRARFRLRDLATGAEPEPPAEPVTFGARRVA